jgi:hypothetical protein
MSAMAPLRVRQIPTTGLQLEGLLSTYPQECRIHKYCISKELCWCWELSNGFNDRHATLPPMCWDGIHQFGRGSPVA